jgi:hypothetical protein
MTSATTAPAIHEPMTPSALVTALKQLPHALNGLPQLMVQHEYQGFLGTPPSGSSSGVDSSPVAFIGAAGLGTASTVASADLAFMAKSRWTSASRSSFFLLIAATERDSNECHCGAPVASGAARADFVSSERRGPRNAFSAFSTPLIDRGCGFLYFDMGAERKCMGK